MVLNRSNGKMAPVWVDVKNVRGGRERLGCNPAAEIRAISCEDLEAVRALHTSGVGQSARWTQLPIEGGDRAALAKLEPHGSGELQGLSRLS